MAPLTIDQGQLKAATKPLASRPAYQNLQDRRGREARNNDFLQQILSAKSSYSDERIVVSASAEPGYWLRELMRTQSKVILLDTVEELQLEMCNRPNSDPAPAYCVSYLSTRPVIFKEPSRDAPFYSQSGLRKEPSETACFYVN